MKPLNISERKVFEGPSAKVTQIGKLRSDIKDNTERIKILKQDTETKIELAYAEQLVKEQAVLKLHCYLDHGIEASQK